MRATPGQIIGGKYELVSLLGTGSMGEVWRARHATLQGEYAVKLVDVTEYPDVAGRFQMEALIAAKLSKKTRHVVSVTDHGEQGILSYLVMELLDGETFDHRIETYAPLGLSEVTVIVAQVARALKYAHADGFVHRDLKPANIFLTKNEDGLIVVKLLDFGIARSMKPIRTRSPFATAKDTLVGTPTYMSPEQTLGLDSVDHRSDLWALAVVAYEALTRSVPFDGESIADVLISIGIGNPVPIRTHLPDLPDSVVAFFDRAFARELSARYSSATELSTALMRAAEGAPGGAMRTLAPSMPGVAQDLFPSVPPPRAEISMIPPAVERESGAPGTPRERRGSGAPGVPRESGAPGAVGASRESGAPGAVGASQSHNDIALPMQRGPRRLLGIALLLLLLLGIGSLARRALREPAKTDALRLGPVATPVAPPSAPSPSVPSVPAPLPASASPDEPPAPRRVPPSPITRQPPPAVAPLPEVAVTSPPPPELPPAASAAPAAPRPPRVIDRGEVF